MRKITKKIAYALADNMGMDELISFKSREILLGDKEPLVFIASMPKAAGTFICHSIAAKHTLPYLHYTDRIGCCEFDIYHPRLLENIKQGGIVHQHTLGTEGNIYYLNRYCISTIVIVRNIYDALYSLYEHLEKYKNKWPIFEYPADYFTKKKEEKIAFIVQIIAPWFLQFYISWYKAQQQKKIDALWISYESFLENKISVINSIESKLKIAADKMITESELGNNKKEALRFNKGVSGRGVEMISNDHKAIIQQMMSFYPDVDFGMITGNT